MKIQIELYDENCLFKMATSGSAGYDLKSRVNVIIEPGEIVKIPVGFAMKLPIGKKADILPRSSFALRGIKVANAPGLCDSDYTNEYAVLLENTSLIPFEVSKYDRIAQMVITDYNIIGEIEIVDKLEKTERDGGFGHSGVNDKLNFNNGIFKKLSLVDEKLGIERFGINTYEEQLRASIKRLNISKDIKRDNIEYHFSKVFEINNNNHNNIGIPSNEIIKQDEIINQKGQMVLPNNSKAKTIYENGFSICFDTDFNNNINDLVLANRIDKANWIAERMNKKYSFEYTKSTIENSDYLINTSIKCKETNEIFNLKWITNYKLRCVNEEDFNPMDFNIDYHKDGYDGFICFYYKEHMWNFKLYNINGKLDCRIISDKYQGVGNERNASFKLTIEDFISFMNNANGIIL